MMTRQEGARKRKRKRRRRNAAAYRHAVGSDDGGVLRSENRMGGWRRRRRKRMQTQTWGWDWKGKGKKGKEEKKKRKKERKIKSESNQIKAESNQSGFASPDLILGNSVGKGSDLSSLLILSLLFLPSVTLLSLSLSYQPSSKVTTRSVVKLVS